MSDELTPEPVKEYVKPDEINAIIFLQKEKELVSLKLDVLQLKLQLSYNLKDTDKVDPQTGLITRA